MGYLEEWQRIIGWVLAQHFNKQDALAEALKETLGVSEDLTSSISRFLSGELERTGSAAVMHVMFWDEVVDKEYPLEFINWWRRALELYDSHSAGTSERYAVRAPCRTPVCCASSA